MRKPDASSSTRSRIPCNNTCSSFPIGNNEQVLLQGILDRVDELASGLRIVDYKSGKVDKKNAKSIEDLFSDPKFKEQFQAMFYAFLLRQQHPETSIQSSLVTLRGMSDGL